MTPAPTTDNVLMLIKVAHDNDKDEVVFEQLLDTLHGVVGGAKFSLEIVSLHQHIYLFVWCKQAQMPALKGQIYAEYPHAEIEFLKDYSNVDLKFLYLRDRIVWPFSYGKRSINGYVWTHSFNL